MREADLVEVWSSSLEIMFVVFFMPYMCIQPKYAYPFHFLYMYGQPYLLPPSSSVHGSGGNEIWQTRLYFSKMTLFCKFGVLIFRIIPIQIKIIKSELELSLQIPHSIKSERNKTTNLFYSYNFLHY